MNLGFGISACLAKHKKRLETAITDGCLFITLIAPVFAEQKWLPPLVG